MNRRVAPLIAAFAAAAAMVPTTSAQAYEPYEATISTAESTGVVGRESAVVVTDAGFPVVAALDDTNDTIWMMSCLDRTCATGTRVDLAAGIRSADIDIALAPNGTPVIAFTYETTSWNDGIRVVTCGDLACSTAVTTAQLSTPDESGHSSIGLAVPTDGLPVVSYAATANWTHSYQVISCTTPTCHAHHSPTWIDGGWGVAGDVVVGPSGDPVVVVSQLDGLATVRLHRCQNAPCTSRTAEQLDGPLRFPKIGTDGQELVVVGTDGSGEVRMVTCESSCGQAQQLSSNRHTGRTVDVSFIDDGHPIVAYHDTANRLWFVDCPSGCLAPAYVTRNSGDGLIGLSVSGGNDVANISYFQRGGSDLGIVRIDRPRTPRRGVGF